MNLPEDFADISRAKEIAHNLYPDEQNIVLIEHSADNIVALVGNKFALRFARSKGAYLRGLYEKHILRRLEGVPTLTIPRILQEHQNPPYVITNFVPGKHISSTDIRAFSHEEQQKFSKSVAQFAYTMHSTFAVSEELPLRQKLELDKLEDGEPWPVYYKRVIHDVSLPDATQDTIAKECYAQWVELCDVSPTVVVHDDLHAENMMFNHNRLTGVVDFGDTNVGTPEQELRQLYRISEEVMVAAVEEYQRLSGRHLNVEAIKLWSIMKELADYSKALAAKQTDHHSFTRASRNLNTWLPEGEWGKGYDLSAAKGYQ
jgi:aminoglycoside phosphotransferase (APT) family kinase protein